jgi:hypothetical protein
VPKSVTPIVTVATSRLSSFLGSGTLSERMSPLLHAKPPGREPLNQSPPGSDVPGNIDLLARTLLSGGIRPALATLLSYDAYPQTGSADNGFNVLSADCAWKWWCPFHSGFYFPFQWGWTTTGAGYVLNLCCRYLAPQRSSKHHHLLWYLQRKTSCSVQRKE